VDARTTSSTGRSTGAAGRIFAFPVSDSLIPIPADALLGRGRVGDGAIGIASFVGAMREAGYKGFIEVEVFNQEIWDTPGDQNLRTVIDRHTQLLTELD
jgi:sugar phosphate isomerase/epimerase